MGLFFDYHGLRKLRLLKKGLKTALTSPPTALRQLSHTLSANANLAFSRHLEKSFALTRIFLVLSFACDSRCTMCALWSDTGFSRKMSKAELLGELTLSDYERLLKEVQPWGAQIVLFGGEPLLSPKWQPIAQKATELGLRVTFSTDGSKLFEQAEEVVALSEHFQVSLDAATPRLHNQIRRYSNLYEKLVAGVQRVEALKKKKRSPLPLIDVGTMILPENLHELDQIVDRVESWKVSIDTLSFQHLEYITPERLKAQDLFLNRPHVNYWQGVVRTPPLLDADLLLEKIEKLQKKKRGHIAHIAFNPEMTEKEMQLHYAGASFQTRRRCSVPWLEAHILPSGDVWVCPDYYAGNITQSSFSNIWNSARSRAIRAFLNSGKRFPACNNCMGNYLY